MNDQAHTAFLRPSRLVKSRPGGASCESGFGCPRARALKSRRRSPPPVQGASPRCEVLIEPEKRLSFGSGCPGCIVVTWQSVWLRPRSGNSYSHGYMDLKPLNDLAQDNGCCILLIRHTNTGRERADPFGGTMGARGAVDTETPFGGLPQVPALLVV
jgi:hypothetical protein